MMQKKRNINFTKMVASGNDFVVVRKNRDSDYFSSSFATKKNSRCPYFSAFQPSSLLNLAKNICDRKYGVGADGLLLLENSKIADVKMRIFNADGSEAEMCGNGARCVAYYLRPRAKGQGPRAKIETKVGIIESQVTGDNVKIRLTGPKEIKLDIPTNLNNRTIRVNFIDTGVPHTVIFVEGLDKIDVVNLGRAVRYHKIFSPKGTNVDFVEALNTNSIKVRTYERGVEDETLACGTGAVAAALITALSLEPRAFSQINVHTKGNEILKVYFERSGNEFSNVWLEGKARIVYEGQIKIRLLGN